jgi:hypothetical protein
MELHMKIELKNVKYAAFNSQETHCFSATVYIDGIRSGTVSNEGHGGPDSFEPYSLQKTLDAYAKTLPRVDLSDMFNDGKVHTIPSSAEILIGNLMNAYLEDRDLKRLCAKKVLFKIPGETYKAGEYNTVKGKFTPEVKTYLVNKYGKDVEIVNERFV